MRGVNLEHLHLGRDRAHGGCLERVDHACDARVVERRGRLVSCVEGNRTGRDDRRPASVGWIEWSAAFPRTYGARFATRMRELRPEYRAVGTHEPPDVREHLDVFVFPKPEILRTDAAFWQNGRCFGEHQRRTAESELAEVDDVPVIREAVVAGVLAHWRNTNAIAQGQRT